MSLLDRFCYIWCMYHWVPILLLLLFSCKPGVQNNDTTYIPADTSVTVVKDSLLSERVVAFAKTLMGTPYQFGCSAPSTGFDCSGFISYVFNHFEITVPRSSVDFTNEGRTIATKDAKPGDLILFTGTNSKIRTVGHIGLIISNDSTGISFIHSSSGSEHSVIITPLEGAYMVRFIKIIRIVE